jgi:4-aminobutyrate aminotransferase-like enzyme
MYVMSIPIHRLELVADRETKEPARGAAAALIEACYKQGVLLLKAGT